MTRLAALLEKDSEPFPLSRVEMLEEMRERNPDLVPDLPPDAVRRIRSEQEIIGRYEPGHALATLPALLAKPEDRARFAAVLQLVASDLRVRDAVAVQHEQAVLARVRALVGSPAPIAAVPARDPAANRPRTGSNSRVCGT